MKLSTIWNLIGMVPKVGAAIGGAAMVAHMASPDVAKSAEVPTMDQDMSQTEMVAEGTYDSNALFDVIDQQMAGSSLNFDTILPASNFVIAGAWDKYAKDYPEDYGMTAEEPFIVSREDIHLLERANQEYYSTFTYIPDDEQFGVEEDFRPAQRMDDVHDVLKMNVADDCDGYGLGLQRYLNETYGIDISATSLVVGIAPGGGGHALLMARTEDGDVMLNNDGTMKFPHEMVAEGFQFTGAQSLIDKSVWHSVSVTGVGVEPTMVELPDYVEEAANTSEAPPIPRMRPPGL